MKNILILDDDQFMRKLAERIFQRAGYGCSQATHAAEARDLLKDNQFDLILCDINMPGESGLDFIRYCSPEYPETAIVMMTGISDRETAGKAIDIGVYGYLIKPFERDQLLITVDNAFRRLALEKENKYQIEKLDSLVLERTDALYKKVQELEVVRNELTQSEEKFRSIFENSPVGIVVVEAENHTIVDVNYYTEKIIGWDRNEIIGKPSINVFCSESASTCPVSSADKNAFMDESEILTCDGSVVSILKKAVLISLPYRKHIINIFIDITERKRLEMQLSHVRKLEAVGQLASGIAHEINTPIQYIGDNVRFLQDAFTAINTSINKSQQLTRSLRGNMPVDTFIKEMQINMEEADIAYFQEEIPIAIEQTLEGVEHVSNIVRSMKEFSHPGLKKKIVVDINHAIRNTIMVSRNEWKYVAEMETDLDPGLPLVSCLPGELNQVFLNMIINAAHAIGDIVNDKKKKKGIIRITTCRSGEDVKICIGDTGPGIPKEIQSKIFDLFFTTKDVGKGTGQGLAICRSVIVEKHGGNLSLESNPGKGTRFIIRIPIE